jgi:hypothetical protein
LLLPPPALSPLAASTCSTSWWGKGWGGGASQTSKPGTSLLFDMGTKLLFGRDYDDLYTPYFRAYLQTFRRNPACNFKTGRKWRQPVLAKRLQTLDYTASRHSIVRKACLQHCCIAPEITRLLIAYSLPRECAHRVVV